MEITPRQGFEDNLRPAELLLRVYRLLECDALQTDGDMIHSLRTTVGAAADEQLILVYNEIFLGLIRERAQIPMAALKLTALHHLLRQAVVAACTGLDAYLPALLRVNLPVIIDALGRQFIPEDNTIKDFFKDLVFDLPDTMRLLGDPDAPLFIANKILGLTSFKYLSSKKGIHVVGSLLGLKTPWSAIAAKLKREEKELTDGIDDIANRRNDIVHRADRARKSPTGHAQEIGYAWTKHSVDTVMNVCLALDELVVERIKQLRSPAIPPSSV